MKKVSIILPVHNSAKYLAECLESINNQVYKDFTLIIIDDGSEDDSLNIINKFMKESEMSIRFIRNKISKGVSAARNRGLEVVDTPFVTFVDSDDVLSPLHISILVKGVTNKSTIMSVTRMTRKGIINFSGNLNFKSLDYNKIMQEVLGWGSIQGYACSKMFRMSVIDRLHIKFCEELYTCEDLLFVIHYLINMKDQNVTFNNSKTYFYRINKNSTTQSKNGIFQKTNNQLVAYSKILQIIKANTNNQKVLAAFYEDYLILLNHLLYITNEEYDHPSNNGKDFILYTRLRNKFLIKLLINPKFPPKNKFVFLWKLIINTFYVR